MWGIGQGAANTRSSSSAKRYHMVNCAGDLATLEQGGMAAFLLDVSRREQAFACIGFVTWDL